MKEFEIWTEGFNITGQTSSACYWGKFKTKTFKEAIEKALLAKDYEPKLYNPEELTYWGCKFFDNEVDARKSFG
jgi:hypothetical protein